MRSPWIIQASLNPGTGVLEIDTQRQAQKRWKQRVGWHGHKPGCLVPCIFKHFFYLDFEVWGAY